MKPSRKRKAFTLFELLLVMAVLIILMAVAYPSVRGWFGDTNLRGGADDVLGAWAEARAHAIDEGVNYKFAVMYGTGRFKIGPDDNTHWQGSDDSKDTNETGGSGPLVLRKTLPEGIVFSSDGTNGSPDANGWVVLINFLPDGTCRDDASIKIEADPREKLRPITIRMRGLTGTVKTE
jgi:prepilin-type N-terminal cleavage/methylation domain-containing protein